MRTDSAGNIKVDKEKSTEKINGAKELCPSISISSLEGSLRKLVKEGELKREGSGKATCYVRLK